MTGRGLNIRHKTFMALDCSAYGNGLNNLEEKCKSGKEQVGAHNCSLLFRRQKREAFMTDPIRLMIVDDQKLMRQGLRTLLELEAGFEIVGEAGDGQTALEAYEELQPDVVLMDIRMPGMDGVEATRRIHERWPKARVIILTTFNDDAYVFEALRVGALGYLL